MGGGSQGEERFPPSCGMGDPSCGMGDRFEGWGWTGRAGDSSGARAAFLVSARVDMSLPQSSRAEMGVAFLRQSPTGCVTSWLQAGREMREIRLSGGTPRLLVRGTRTVTDK